MCVCVCVCVCFLESYEKFPVELPYQMGQTKIIATSEGMAEIHAITQDLKN